MDGYDALGMDARAIGWVNGHLSWFGHGCTGQSVGWHHGCYHGLGMGAWGGTMDLFRAWASMHCALDGLVAWTCANCAGMCLHAYRQSAANEGDRPSS